MAANLRQTKQLTASMITIIDYYYYLEKADMSFIFTAG